MLQEAAKDKAENYADGLKLKDLKTQLTMCDLELAGKKAKAVPDSRSSDAGPPWFWRTAPSG